MTTTTEEQIRLWAEAKENLYKYKNLEGKLRREICADLLKGKEPGSHLFTIGSLPVKATRKLIYNIDPELKEMFDEGLLSAAEEACLKVNISLIPSQVKGIAHNKIPNILKHMTVKDAMPTLELDPDI